MTIAFGAIGAKSAGGTTSVAVAYPASVGAGDALILADCGWPSSAGVNAISGWTVQPKTGGTGTAADSHTTTVAAFHKEAAGGETGTVTVTRGGTPTGQLGIMARYTKTAAAWDAIAVDTGMDNVHDANRSMVSILNLDCAPNDLLVIAVGVDTDDALTITSPTVTATGFTFGTVTRRTSGAGVTTGEDGNVELFDVPVLTGTGTATLTFSFTTATAQCGSMVVTRLREVSGATYTPAPSDAVGLTDSLAVIQGANITPADVAGITDVATTALALHRSIADGVSIIDTDTGQQVDTGISVSDAVQVTDTTASVVAVAMTAPDAVGITDSLTADITISGSPSDPVGVADVSTTAVAAGRGQDDPLLLADTVGTLVVSDRGVPDPVGVTDSVGIVLDVVLPLILFRPPITRRVPMGRDALFSRMSIPVGGCVVKTTNGTYRLEALTHDPTRDDIAIVYDGGHLYPVDAAEAADLTNAGYGEYLEVVS